VRREGRAEGNYQPASRERAADLMRGVWTQGFWGASPLEPIFASLSAFEQLILEKTLCR
jgi:hypothetical protein